MPRNKMSLGIYIRYSSDPGSRGGTGQNAKGQQTAEGVAPQPPAAGAARGDPATMESALQEKSSLQPIRTGRRNRKALAVPI